MAFLQRSLLSLRSRASLLIARPVLGRSYTSTPYSTEPVTVMVRHGYPVVSVPLPSRRENCEFTLRPYLQNVGHFVNQVKTEDLGIDNVAVYGVSGQRIAQSTGVDILLQEDFDLVVNGYKYRVEVPKDFRYSLDGEKSVADVRNMVHKLYSQLHVDAHQLGKERELRGRLESAMAELAPIEAQSQALVKKSTGRSNMAVWGGMAFMSLQFGFFARLTWWEYSWDIMEPVTYFATYATSMAMFAYFVITRQDYAFPIAAERNYLHNFHRMAGKQKFDVDRYNHLKETVTVLESELSRLHDPLTLNLPTPPPDTTN